MTDLQFITNEAKQLVLKTYYKHVIAAKNLKDAIMISASFKMNRGDISPGNPKYGYLSKLEHSNLEKLMLNISMATEFCFRGTKEEAAIGGDLDLKVTKKESRNMDASDIMKMSIGTIV